MDYRPGNRRALELVGEIVARVRPDQFGNATPCAPWTLGELLEHVVSQNIRFAAAARGEDADAACPADGADLGGDPARAFAESAKLVNEAFAAPELVNRLVVLPELPAPLPGMVAVGFHLTDTYVHGWDIAVSAGIEFAPPADLTAAVLDRAAKIPDAARADGGPFGPVVAADPDAGDVAQVLALTGRAPDWSPTD
jgi:uncharacterized protein (TIGR03086 family)